MKAWLSHNEVSDEVSPGNKLPLTVLMGGNDLPLTIYKEYGPTIFASLRIKASLERGCWVIERATGPEDDWKEWATIPAQLDEDFTDPLEEAKP